MHKAFTRHAPPISLKDLADCVGVAALGTTVAALPGAIEQGTKGNESWRYAFGGCVVIGYRHSAVAAGDRAALVPLVAARVRAAVLPVPPSLAPATKSGALRILPEPPKADPDQDMAEPLHTGASYDRVCDWAEQPWAALWIAHRRALGPQVRAFGEQLDPFAWAVQHGLITD